jgi:5-formyltetrahydrofolate cyclo-ligase
MMTANDTTRINKDTMTILPIIEKRALRLRFRSQGSTISRSFGEGESSAHWSWALKGGLLKSPNLWVGLYWGMPYEPVLQHVALASGVSQAILFPRMAPDFRLEWVAITDADAQMEAHPELRTLKEPKAHLPAAVTLPEVCLVPALAVDKAGTRLGQGGGYYDRQLRQWRQQGWQGKAIGVVWHAHYLSEECLPYDPWDEPVDGVLTEQGLFWIL